MSGVSNTVVESVGQVAMPRLGLIVTIRGTGQRMVWLGLEHGWRDITENLRTVATAIGKR